MKTAQTLVYILSEDFEVPTCLIELQEAIEEAIEYYENTPMGRKENKQFKIKLNELMQEYNERRGMKIYNSIK